MKNLLRTQRLRIVLAAAMVVFLVIALIHPGHHQVPIACVLLFPVFLFGLLNLSEFFQNRKCVDDVSLPQAPALTVLFQRPPPPPPPPASN
jgi:hypothetical protein